MATDERARTYHRWQFGLSLAGFVLSALYLAALLATGAAVALRDRLAALTSSWWLELLLCLVVLAGAYRLMTLPLSWLSGFWLPSRFGLLHQPFLRWLWDGVKAALIGGALGLLGAEIVYGLCARRRGGGFGPASSSSRPTPCSPWSRRCGSRPCSIG